MSSRLQNLVRACCSFRPGWAALTRRSIADRQRRKASPQLQVSAEALEARYLLAAASVVVVQDVQFFTTEAGGSTNFTVVLSAAPKGRNKTVEVPIRSTNTQEGDVSVSKLIFKFSNWDEPQSVTITGINDQIEDGDRNYQIELGKLVTKARNFRRVNPNDLSTYNWDDDGAEPGVTINPDSLILDDASSRSVTVRLAARPTSDVTVKFTVTKGIDQAQISHDTLTFTSSNWNVAQSLLFGAFMDERYDGDQPFELKVETVSADTEYSGKTWAPFVATIRDIDQLAISLDGNYIGGFNGTVLNGGAQVTGDVNFTITNDLLAVTSPEGGTGTIDGDAITFTHPDGTTFEGNFTENLDDSVSASGTWQRITDGNIVASGTWTAVDLFHVSHRLRVSQSTNVVLNEGQSNNYLFSLTAPPTANVIVTLTPTSETDQANLSKTTLTFTPANWNVAQFVAVTAVTNDGDDGDHVYQFEATTSSTDPNYTGLAPVVLSATIQDPANPDLDLDGDYTGTYSGAVVVFGTSTPVNGEVAFSISGEDITVTKPAAGTATLTDGEISFAPTTGTLAGAMFKGTFTENGDGSITASGTWSYSQSGLTGAGTWTATRPAP